MVQLVTCKVATASSGGGALSKPTADLFMCIMKMDQVIAKCVLELLAVLKRHRAQSQFSVFDCGFLLHYRCTKMIGRQGKNGGNMVIYMKKQKMSCVFLNQCHGNSKKATKNTT